MGMDGEKKETNAAWKVADIKGLTIQAEQLKGMLVVKPEGRVDGSNSLEFQKTVGAQIGENLTGLVLDLEHLTYISSAGLRVILLTAQQLQKKSVKFDVCSLSEPISEVFQISGFDKIISIYSTRDGALSELGE